MLNSSNKNFKMEEVGNSILMPISQPDTMSSIGPRNLPEYITSKEDDLFSIGNTEGIFSCNYTRNQFDICTTKIISLEDKPSRILTSTEAMRKASLGLESGSACRCKYCKTFRCPCKKRGRICNSKCHKGKACFNYNSQPKYHLDNYLSNYIYT